MFSSNKRHASSARAVVDWIVVEVRLSRASHGGHLKNAFEAQGVSYVKAMDAGAGSAATRFQIRIQDPPDTDSLRELLRSLEENYGFTSAPEITAIEVSVDFHKGENEAVLNDTTLRLMSSLAPSSDLWPRLIGHRDGSGSPWVTSGVELDPKKSLFIGNKDDNLMWRIYQKRTDQTTLDDAGKPIPKSIPPGEWRA